MRAVTVDGGGGGGSPVEVGAVKAVSSVVVKVKVTAALHLSVQHRCGGGGGEGSEGGIVGGGEG